MSLELYLDESFTSGSIVDPVDTFTGNGVSATFVLVNKSVQRLGSTIQVEGNQYYQYNGGFTKDIGTNSFTLSVVPTFGARVVAPGISQLVFPVFDQNVVSGVTNPRQFELPVWIGDGTEIQNQYYLNLPQNAGIEISLVDLVSSTGAQVNWGQFAAASTTTGAALSYGATGVPLYTAGLSAFGVLSASAAAGASSIFCTTASAFTVGDYVIFNIGNSSQEVRKISSIVNSTGFMIFTTLFDFNHLSNETVINCGRKFWCKITIPTNATNNTAVNFYDLAIRRRGRVVSRL